MTIRNPCQVLFIGISGPTCSGKSTLSRLLSKILQCQILYQDDFYKKDDDIPIDEVTGEGNWDSQESLDIPRFMSVLNYIRQTGLIPGHHKSIEEQQEVGMCGVTNEMIEKLRETTPGQPSKIVLVDGFLLYPVPDIREHLDIKLILRSSYNILKERRDKRHGYATQTSYWVDPPNYFDHVCWPWHLKNHAHLFKDGNVEGEVLPGFNILAQPNDCQSMEDILMWAVGAIVERLPVNDYHSS